MSKDNQRLGKNPLSSLTSETEGESTEVLRNNLISYKARKRCIHLKYSENYKQHHCDSPRSRQGGLLGKDWKEKCRYCHVKVTDEKEPEPEKKETSNFITKILSIR